MTTKKPSKKRFFLVAALIGLVCLIVSLVDRAPLSRPETIVTVGLEDTTRTNGLFYVVGESLPFSGQVIEQFDSGSLKARTMIQQGLLDGLSEGWFDNGQMQIQEHFKLGISEGKRLKWHLNGNLKSEVEIVNGELDGLFHEWHENGFLAREIDLSMGLAHGKSRSWFSSGYLQARAVLESGELVKQIFFEDGQVGEAPTDASVPGFHSPSTKVPVKLTQGRGRQ
jgi:antitoxin component YwqK of YwqJK toxin-antitoxin module